MAFVYDIETDFDDAPMCDAHDVYIIEFALGYHLDRSENEIMSVMLVPGASYLLNQIENVYDLKFGIRTRCLQHKWKVGDPRFDMEASRRCIRPNDRAMVLDCVLRAVVSLVRHVRPAHLTMVTFYPHLPRKALHKFERILERVCALGYEPCAAFGERTGATIGT